MPHGKQIPLDDKERYIAYWQVVIGAIITGGIAFIGIGMGFYIAAGKVPFQSANFLESLYALVYFIGGFFLFIFGMRLNTKTFGPRRATNIVKSNAVELYSLKILVDEMLDGLDMKLIERGYHAQSVKKLIEQGEKIHSDFSVLKYVETHRMVLVTEDEQNIRGCNENMLLAARFGQNDKIEGLLTKLEEFESNDKKKQSIDRLSRKTDRWHFLRVKQYNYED